MGILDGGSDIKIANKLMELRNIKRQADNQLSSVDGILNNMDRLNPPNVPTVSDINGGLNVVNSRFNSSLSEIDGITDVAGSCLDGAMGAVYGLARDAYDLVGDAMASLYGINGMSGDFIDIMEAYNKMKAMIAKLGIQDLIADINSTIGCMSSSSSINDTVGQINSITRDLGLYPDGTEDQQTYYDNIKNKITGLGFDPSFATNMTDGLTTVNTASEDMRKTATTTAKSKISEIKNQISQSNHGEKTPTRFF